MFLRGAGTQGDPIVAEANEQPYYGGNGNNDSVDSHDWNYDRIGGPRKVNNESGDVRAANENPPAYLAVNYIIKY